MKISIVGCGYVGIVTGVCLADSGHKIYFFDKNQEKISNFKKGKPLIFEKNLKKKIISARKKKNIFFCDNLNQTIKNTDVSFICVGTPFGKNNINLKYIKNATNEIADRIKRKKKYTLIYKSTIPPKTIEKVCIPLLKKKLGNKMNKNCNVIFNPEFLREGNAIYDFENPKRIIVGIRNNISKKIVEKIYKKYKKKSKIIFTDIKTAEFIKYFSNSFFSLLISYSNEISNLCYKLGIDFIDVLNAFKLDSRFNSKNKIPEALKYLVPGIGYGGSCFPKDIKTFIKFANKNKFDLSILKKVDEINSKQPKIISEIILNEFKRKKVRNCLFLGITFKENTDDIRNSTSIDLVNFIAKKKLNIFIYDPIFSKEKFLKNKSLFNKRITYLKKINYNSKFDSLIINNNSIEFKKIVKFYNNKFKSLIFDSRRIYEKEKFKNYSGSGLKSFVEN